MEGERDSIVLFIFLELLNESRARFDCFIYFLELLSGRRERFDCFIHIFRTVKWKASEMIRVSPGSCNTSACLSRS